MKKIKILLLVLLVIVTTGCGNRKAATPEDFKEKAKGYTINDVYLVSMFDSSYENCKMIKSMKTTKNGFSYYSKVLSSDDIESIDSMIQKSFVGELHEVE